MVLRRPGWGICGVSVGVGFCGVSVGMGWLYIPQEKSPLIICFDGLEDVFFFFSRLRFSFWLHGLNVWTSGWIQGSL